MPQKTVVVSFEGDKVHIIYATKTKTSFVIDTAVTVDETEFDNFLSKEKTREFIIINSFTHFFSDTFHVPPAQDKLISVIIENELRKLSKFKDFSFIHTIVGEQIIEQKRTKEVFAFAVENEHIRKIISRFTSKGKVVKALYPDIFAVAGFVGTGKETVIGVLETGTNKHLFVVKEGRIFFVRIVQAFDKGMRDHDAQNITMTINYCRQNLKLFPQRIVLIGNLCRNFFVKANIGIPLVSFTHLIFRQQIKGKDASVDYMLPIAGLFIKKSIAIDLLPDEDRTIFKTDRIMRYITQGFLVFMAIILIQAGIIAQSIGDLRHDINTMRKNLPDINGALEQYHIKTDAFNLYRPFLEAYRKYAAQPDIYTLMNRLSEASGAGIEIRSIAAGMGGTLGGEIPAGDPSVTSSFAITLEGGMQAEGYAEMQKQYQHFLSALSAIKNLSVAEQSLDLRTHSFRIKVACQ